MNAKEEAFQFDLFNTEIPEGFICGLKNDIEEGNICNQYDARKLCQLNEN